MISQILSQAREDGFHGVGENSDLGQLRAVGIRPYYQEASQRLVNLGGLLSCQAKGVLSTPRVISRILSKPREDGVPVAG